MPVEITWMEQMREALQSAVLSGGLTLETQSSGDFEMHLPATESRWRSLGAGVKVFDVGERLRLMRITFRHTVASDTTNDRWRLKVAVQKLEKTLRRSIPQGSSGVVRIDHDEPEEVPFGRRFTCSAVARVQLSVPAAIVDFIEEKGLHIVSGRCVGRGHVAEPLAWRTDDYEYWEMEVRLPDGEETEMRQITVGRSKRTGLPMTMRENGLARE